MWPVAICKRLLWIINERSLRVIEDIKVSIFCATYNQEKYISRTLESLVSQKTNFKFEILVHDDCSTDRTTEIVKKYVKMYPQLIIPIYEKQNQYKMGNDIFGNICIPKARGKYIAICEGDDFWIDDQKLQIQFDALERKPEISMCACRAMVVTASDEKEIGEIRPKKQDSILTIEEVISGGGGYIATDSLFFRKELFVCKMEYEKVISFDYTMQIKGALCNGILYLDKKMVAYRKEAENSWTLMVEKDKEKRNLHIRKEIEMLKKLDCETEQKYHTVIKKHLEIYTPYIVQMRINRQDVLKKMDILERPIYIWGMGLRGDACQEFCKEEAIQIAGVCDIKNSRIGELSQYGYKIENTETVLKNAGGIIASNKNIYEVLKNSGFQRELINLQQFIPLG